MAAEPIRYRWIHICLILALHVFVYNMDVESFFPLCNIIFALPWQKMRREKKHFGPPSMTFFILSMGLFGFHVLFVDFVSCHEWWHPDQPFVPQRCFHVIMSLCTMSKSSYMAKNLHATQSEHARILTWKKRVAKECNDKPGPFLHRRSLKSPFIQAPRLLHLVHSVGGICMQP